MEVEAVDDGVIGKILISEGTENVKVNDPIAVILNDGESADDIDVSKLNGAADASSSAPSEDAPSESAEEQPAPEATAPSDPELPDGVQMVETTIRDALRDAMGPGVKIDTGAASA